METKPQKPCCPNCRSENLKLIGCVLLSPEGMIYEGNITSKSLIDVDFAMTREVLRCECGQHIPLDAARKAADLPAHPILWENTESGIECPIICPQCGNHEHFVCEQIQSISSSDHIQIIEGKIVKQGEGADFFVHQTINLRYKCDVEDCDGVIELHPANYELIKSP